MKKLILPRRSLILGGAVAICAPAIVRAGFLQGKIGSDDAFSAVPASKGGGTGTAPTVDVSTIGSSSAGTTLASDTNGTLLTTTQTNDIIVAFVWNDTTNASGAAVNVASFSSLNGLTYTKRSSVNFHSGATGTPFVTLDIWWALATSTISNERSTATFSGTYDNAGMSLVAVHGCNTSSPWDPNSSLSAPLTANSSASSAPSAGSISITNSGTLMFLFGAVSVSNVTQALQTTGTNITSIVQTKKSEAGTNFSTGAVGDAAFTTPQSGITAAFGTSWAGWIVLADALTS